MFNTQNKTIHIQRKRLLISWMNNGPQLLLGSWHGVGNSSFVVQDEVLTFHPQTHQLNAVLFYPLIWCASRRDCSRLDRLWNAHSFSLSWKSYLDLYISSKGFCFFLFLYDFISLIWRMFWSMLDDFSCLFEYNWKMFCEQICQQYGLTFLSSKY